MPPEPNEAGTRQIVDPPKKERERLLDAYDGGYPITLSEWAAVNRPNAPLYRVVRAEMEEEENGVYRFVLRPIWE